MNSTRRSFLRQGALAGTSLFLAPRLRAQGSHDDLRIAVIGLRGRGNGLLRSLLDHQGVRVTALCDVDPSILDARVAEMDQRGHKVSRWKDFRDLCGSDEIDAVVIATPNHTHALIGLTAAAHGKHAYIEKPVSHDVHEGRLLAEAQEKSGVILQHGFQRRSETAWREAFEWIAEGHLGELTLARGLCYKPRKSIGKVKGPQTAPEGLDYNLWCGPKPMQPIMRRQFHYDWHWQFLWGNGDLGNQGPHQLDVCRWALGDPPDLPRAVQSFGGRFAHDDDGEWPNTQVVALDYEKAPILFEVRGLPAKNLDYGAGMDEYHGQSIGNVIEYQGGALIGGHRGQCRAVDSEGTTLREFQGGGSHLQTWIDAIRSGRQDPARGAESGHLSSALAHLGNISWMLGHPHDGEPETDHQPTLDAYSRMRDHLAANGVEPDPQTFKMGPRLELLPGEEKFAEDWATRADPLLRGVNRDEFPLPKP